MRRHVRALALVVLAAVAALVGDAFLPHTDDGCAVEVHCLACRTAVSTRSAATATFALPVDLPLVMAVAEAPLPHAAAAPVAAPTSRGPPSPAA